MTLTGLETFENLPDNKKESIINSALREFSSKSYNDANTDSIVKDCSISKGSLFHYFGSKKGLYLYLLRNCVAKVADSSFKSPDKNASFYDVLFASLGEKFSLYKKYPMQFKLMNLAAKESGTHVALEKQQILNESMITAQKRSFAVLQVAVLKLNLKEELDPELLLKGLYAYVNTITMQYLHEYSGRQNEFFESAEKIKQEMKQSIDLFLFGIVKDG